jgi:hypothetical protein
MFSNGAQHTLVNPASNQPGLLGSAIDDALPYLYRTNPLLAGRVGQ